MKTQALLTLATVLLGAVNPACTKKVASLSAPHPSGSSATELLPREISRSAGETAVARTPVVSTVSPVATPAPAPAPAPATSAPVAERPEEGCLVFEYRHQELEGHRSEESCSHHRNLIRLKHSKVHSLCIRVDGTPVKYQQNPAKPDELILGAIAGPSSRISVRYCLGKSRCVAEDCVIPRDEFADALSAADEAGGESNWNESGKAVDVSLELDPVVKRELARIEESEAEKNTISVTFDNWLRDAGNVSCGTRTAKASPISKKKSL